MTLPLIFAINSSNENDKKWLINSVKNHNKDKKRVEQIINFVKEKGGLTYATQKMNDFKDEALSILNDFSDSPSKESLKIMLTYVTERKK